ncbi:MAG: GNAT family N-acetyltransferase [Spirochaetaceae bacterium]|nr:GNAT family N-acetyltransferase [Spirochaetaceae bacterium]
MHIIKTKNYALAREQIKNFANGIISDGGCEGNNMGVYLVAEVDGKIAGYIYAGRFAKRAAYDWAAETSIYIGDDFHRLGLGRLLYEKLEHILAAQNITNVYAGIATPADEEDQYITKNSELFHAAIGYKTVGRFSKCGCKFGKWYDLIYMEKIISAHNLNPEPFVPFSKLNLQGLL